ncbi:MAG: bis(5'-nucleosyl)-tetraphosphatase (symmetrical) YqeK [Lachnospiraceae bacterium]|nr:bis(5'-nucleosyl)-tetraphosphatase (symmetrical) YqeK [Lachnospiraceae bacterium]
MVKNLKNIKKDLKTALDKDRYEHTLGVAYTAMCLAMRYEISLEKAEMAGLLHDCAKCMSDEKKIKKCIEHNINISEIEKEQPYLLHAKVGAYIAMDKYGINDMEIINAILKHTTGSPDMSMLEKIIYVADYIEPNRNKAENLPTIRKLAFQDIDMAVFVIMRDTVKYLNDKNKKMDTHTLKAYEYYKEIIEKRDED